MRHLCMAIIIRSITFHLWKRFVTKVFNGKNAQVIENARWDFTFLKGWNKKIDWSVGKRANQEPFDCEKNERGQRRFRSWGKLQQHKVRRLDGWYCMVWFAYSHRTGNCVLQEPDVRRRVQINQGLVFVDQTNDGSLYLWRWLAHPWICSSTPNTKFKKSDYSIKERSRKT